MDNETRPAATSEDPRIWWGIAALAGLGVFAILWLIAGWSFLLALVIGIVVAALLGWLLTTMRARAPAAGTGATGRAARADDPDRAGPASGTAAPLAGGLQDRPGGDTVLPGATGIPAVGAVGTPKVTPTSRGADDSEAADASGAGGDAARQDVQADAAAPGREIWEADEGRSGEPERDAAEAFDASGEEPATSPDARPDATGGDAAKRDVQANASVPGREVWETDEGHSDESARDAAEAFDADPAATSGTPEADDDGDRADQTDRADDVEADAAAPGSGIWEDEGGRTDDTARDAARAFDDGALGSPDTPAAAAADRPDGEGADEEAADGIAPSPAGAPADAADEGTKPELLDAPRDGAADDLKRIRGIGPKMEGMLNELGVYHFAQIASWSSDEVAWVDGHLEGFRGRVSRDDWVSQAGELAEGRETDFSRRVGEGDVY